MSDILTPEQRQGYELARRQISAVIRALPDTGFKMLPRKDAHEPLVVDMAGLRRLADAIETLEPEAA